MPAESLSSSEAMVPEPLSVALGDILISYRKESKKKTSIDAPDIFLSSIAGLYGNTWEYVEI